MKFFASSLVNPPKVSGIDESNVVSLSESSLAALGISSEVAEKGEWVILQYQQKQHPAKAILHSTTETTVNSPTPMAYISPCLAFNMGISFFKSNNNIEVLIFPFSDQPQQQSLQPAKEVHLARVLSPMSSGTENYSLPLWKYFIIPRLVSIGDVFGITTQSLPSIVNQFHFEAPNITDSSETDEERQQSACICFVVTKIVPQDVPSAIIDRAITKLVQQGSVSSYIPEKLSSFMLGRKTCVESDPFLKLKKIAIPMTKQQANKRSPFQKITTLLYGPIGMGKRSLCNALADEIGVNLLQFNCFTAVEMSESGTETALKKALETAGQNSPCILCLHGIESLERAHFNAMSKKEAMLVDALREWQEREEEEGYAVMIVATTPQRDDLRPATRSCFIHQVEVPVPNEKERTSILEFLLSETPLSENVSIKELALKTASFSLSDFRSLVALASKSSVIRITKDGGNTPKLTQEDFNFALSQLQSRQGILIGRPKIPNIHWTDIGGLETVKQEIIDTIKLPLTHAHLFPPGTRHRSGILLYGPPGTGKTLLAKAVATELTLNFLSVKGPELISMYVGESEKNIRSIFQTARDAAPCIIFFDELDSLAPKRGAGADSGGVMDRVVSQLLSELDGVQKATSVFVIGATNRPDLVDPALLCPGRFDRLLYLGVAATPESKLKIIQAQVKNFKLDPDVNLEEVAKLCPSRLTGADMYALCSGAMLAALREIIDSSSANKNQKQNNNVIVHMKHFISALSKVTPSVSEQELHYYQELHAKFQPST